MRAAIQPRARQAKAKLRLSRPRKGNHVRTARSIMKLKRNTSSMFESPRRRRRLPIVRPLIAIAVVAVLALAWQRGGEQTQAPVEKAIPADKLGQ